MTKPTNPFGSMPQGPWYPWKEAKPDRIIQLNCREVHTHTSYKATRTMENFNNWGAKMILLSDELWSIANTSKSFANGSKWIIRNNLGLSTLIFILFRTFKNIIMDLMIQKYRLGKEIYIKQVNTWEWQKIMVAFSRKRSCLKRIRGYNTEDESRGSRHSFAR